MAIIDDLLTEAFSSSPDVPVQDVLIGLHWTAVQSRFLGLATTCSEATCCYAEDIRDAGQLHQASAHQLANYLRSGRPLEACVGLAALNSFLPFPEQDVVELNARDLLIEQGRDRNVALIGHFAFVEEMRRVARQLWVLELNPVAGDLPAGDAPEILPQAEVIGITASTLINHTFDDLAGMFPAGSLVVMLGPSTPMCRALFDYNVDVLAGARAAEPAHLLRLIGQGSPLHKPRGMRRITLAKDRLPVVGRRDRLAFGPAR